MIFPQYLFTRFLQESDLSGSKVQFNSISEVRLTSQERNMTRKKVNKYFGKDLEAMSFANNYHRWLLAEFLPYIRGSVADVGAGVGDVSRMILKTNITSLTAFEPSINMYPLLKQALGTDKRVRTVNGFFGKEEARNCFDSVLYVNVLEHIENDAAELAIVRAMLAQEGHLLIFVPALPWLYSEFDRQIGHFRRYTKKNLVELTQRAGFSIVKARYFDVAGIIPWYINFTLLKNTVGVGSVFLYERLVVPAMRVIEGLVPPPIGKNVLLVAKKN
jgi:SAM-dependent methyltransferase